MVLARTVFSINVYLGLEKMFWCICPGFLLLINWHMAYGSGMSSHSEKKPWQGMHKIGMNCRHDILSVKKGFVLNKPSHCCDDFCLQDMLSAEKPLHTSWG